MNAKQATVLATVRTSADVFLWRDADVASETMAFTAEEDLTAPVARSVNDIMAAWAGKAAVSATANAPDRRQAAVRPEGPMGHGYLTLYERADCLVARGQAWPHSPSHPAYLNRTLCVIYYDGQGAAPYATKYSNMAS